MNCKISCIVTKVRSIEGLYIELKCYGIVMILNPFSFVKYPSKSYRSVINILVVVLICRKDYRSKLRTDPVHVCDLETSLIILPTSLLYKCSSSDKSVDAMKLKQTQFRIYIIQVNVQ